MTDGISANDKYIDAKVTLNVNEPSLKISEVGEVDYKTTDVQNHVIVDLNDHITASDSSLTM